MVYVQSPHSSHPPLCPHCSLCLKCSFCHSVPPSFPTPIFLSSTNSFSCLFSGYLLLTTSFYHSSALCKALQCSASYKLPGASEAFHSWQRSWGRRLGICKGGIEPQESPWIFSSIYPPKKPESAYFIALCSHLWLYWGLSPTTILLFLSKS